jgi:hypothetical protein
MEKLVRPPDPFLPQGQGRLANERAGDNLGSNHDRT